MTDLTSRSSEKTAPGDGAAVDVIVAGGGLAGLAGALTLVRARRSVLVVYASHPRNAPAVRAHGYLTRDGTPPLELLAAGRATLAARRPAREADAAMRTTGGAWPRAVRSG